MKIQKKQMAEFGFLTKLWALVIRLSHFSSCSFTYFLSQPAILRQNSPSYVLFFHGPFH